MKIRYGKLKKWSTPSTGGNHAAGSEVSTWPWWKQIFVAQVPIEMAKGSKHKTTRTWFYTRIGALHIDITRKVKP